MGISRAVRALLAALLVAAVVPARAALVPAGYGNSQGNLANGGFAAGDGNRAFYVDGGILPAKGNPRSGWKLEGDYAALNLDGDFLYYLQRGEAKAVWHGGGWNAWTGDIEPPDGGEERLTETFTPYRVAVDGEAEPQRLADAASVADGLCAYSNFTLAGGFLYFISGNGRGGRYDVPNRGGGVDPVNYHSGNSVYRMDLDGGNLTELIPDVGNDRPVMAVAEDGIHVVERFKVPGGGAHHRYLVFGLDGSGPRAPMGDGLQALLGSGDVVSVVTSGSLTFFDASEPGDGVRASVIRCDAETGQAAEIVQNARYGNRSLVYGGALYYYDRANLEEHLYEYEDLDVESFGIWRADLDGGSAERFATGGWFLDGGGHPQDVQIGALNGTLLCRTVAEARDPKSGRVRYSYSPLEAVDLADGGQLLARRGSAPKASKGGSGGGSGQGGASVRTTGSANLRSGPGLDYPSVGSVSGGTRMTYLGESATDDRGVDWYLVRHGSGEAWVSSRYAKLSGGGDPEPEGGAPSGAYVRATGELNVRSRPNLNGSVLGSMSAGDTAEYLGERDTDDRGVEWYRIAYRGGSGWVSSRYGNLIE